MREQRMTLERELREVKRDCEHMASLLEEQDLKRYPGVGGGNIDDRERMVKEGEQRLREQ
jgi:hypothetical protein